MAITTEAIMNGPYEGTGAEDQEFPVTFQTDSADGVAVYLDGTLINPTAYTFERNETTGTGTVIGTFDGEVTIHSDPAFTRSGDFQRFGPYFPDNLNPHLDKAAIRDLWLRGQTDRAPKVPLGYEGPSLPAPADMAGMFLVGNGDGSALVPSAGGGADAGLRADLAASTGASLVSVAGGGTLQAWLDNLNNNEPRFGLFSELVNFTIPADQVYIWSTGNLVEGVGAFIAKRDATVNAAAVLAHPLFCQLDATGAGFRIDEPTITGQMAGEAGANAADINFTATNNHDGLQALCDYVDTIPSWKRKLKIDFSSGGWGLDETLVIPGQYYRSHEFIGGPFKYTGTGPLDLLIDVDGQPFQHLSGLWSLFGSNGVTGLLPIADREVKRGIRFRNVNSSKFGDFYGQNFRRFLAIEYPIGDAATNNNIGLRVGQFQGVGCGVVGRGVYNVSSAFTATHAGAAYGLDNNQQSTVELASQALYDDVEEGDPLIFMGEVYHIVDIPEDAPSVAARTVIVHPWITSPADPTTNVNSGTLWGGYGGVLHIRTNDAEGMQVERVMGNFVGTGVKHEGQYAITVHDLLVENCTSTMEIGLGSSNICRGITVGNYHTEGSASQTENIGGTLYQVGFEVILYTLLRCEITIQHVSAVGLDNDSGILQGFRLVSPQSADAVYSTAADSPYGFRMNFGGQVYTSNGFPPRSYGPTIVTSREMSNAQDRNRAFITANTFAFTTFYDRFADRFLGECHHWKAEVLGTANATGAPSGNVTVALGASDAAAGITINGGAGPVTFAATAARMLDIRGYFDYANEDWIVKNILA